MADRYVRNVLQWVSDKQSIISTVNDQKRIAESITDIRKAGDTAYDRRIAQIADEQKRATSSIDDIRKASDRAYDVRVQQLAGENDMRRTQESITRQAFSSSTQQLPIAQRLAEAEQARTNAAQAGITAQQELLASLRAQSGFAGAVSGSGLGATGSGAGVGRALQTAGTQLYMLPDVGPSTEISRILIIAGRATEALNLSLLTLGGLGVAAAVAGLAFKAVSDAQEKATESAKRYTEALEDSAGKTQADIRSQIADQDSLLASYREGRQTLLNYKEQLDAIGNDPAAMAAATGSDVAAAEAVQARFQSIYYSLSQATGGAIDSAASLNAALTESETEISNAERQYGFLTVALNSNAVAAATAAEAAIAAADADVAATERRIARNIEYNQLLATGSADQVRGLIEADRIRKDVLQAFVGNIEAQGIVSEEAAAQAAAYRTEIDDLITHQDTLTKNILPLVEARERESEAIQRALDIDQLTRAEREARERAARREWEMLEELIHASTTSAASVEELTRQQQALERDIDAVSAVTDTYADQLEREANALQALTDSTDAYLEALEWEVDARQKMAEITTEINRIETERVAKLTELAAELSANQTELWRKAGEDVLAAEGKAQEAREKQQEQHWKRVKEINDRAFAAQSNAIAARDVLAYYLSRKQQAEDLKREEEANDDRLKQIDDALEDQKDAIAKRLKEQLATLEANYRKQVDATNDAARKATDIQRQAYREQETALQNAIMAQRNITLAAQQIRSGDELRHQTLLTEITRNGAQYIETLWLNLMNAMIAGMPAGGGGGFPPIVPIGGPGGGGGPLPTPYTPGVAGGGLPSPAASARGGAVINMPVTITASDEQAAVREFTSAFREARRRMG